MGITRRGLLRTGQMTMLNSSAITIAICLVALTPFSAFGQPQGSAQQKPATAAVLGMITGIENALNAVAEEMPADKYDFAPTEGSFRGVRNFGHRRPATSSHDSAGFARLDESPACGLRFVEGRERQPRTRPIADTGVKAE